MDQEFYREYAQIEDTHWWFRGRRAIFSRVLGRLGPDPARRILDIGFGTGAMLGFLSSYGRVVGMEMSAEAVRFARTRTDQPMLLGDIGAIPVRSQTMDLVTAFDIVEHVEDDAAALRELARVCRPKGRILVTVPAFQFLWGRQDTISHHRRRYTRGQLARRVEAAGFRILRINYFNTILFPAVAAIRLARRLRKDPERDSHSDFTMNKPGLVNDVLARVLAAEAVLVAHLRLPAGVSLFCLGERSS